MTPKMSKPHRITRDGWEELHSQSRYLPRYPQDDVVRWALSNFSKAQRQQTKILDLGCGAGRHAIFFASEGFNTTATDRSPSGVEETLRRACEGNLNIEATTSELDNLPYADVSFDAVLCYGVLCYLDQKALVKAISEMRRVLRPDGKAFVMTRSDKDFRANYATHIAGITYQINGKDAGDYPAKGEIGMLHSFPSAPDVRELFDAFTEIEIDRNSRSVGGGSYTNDDWLIFVTR